jgi:peptidoglycan hydrolase-like protein with peptidoglycan-binding domain
MPRDYSKTEVLDIIEREANERGIPRDDFMRFAYIETGGTFDEQASRGPRGAKGLFQFVPSTAGAYGIQGRELDPVANTDAAARLYLDNRHTLVNRHERDARPYLSGKPEPDGLDMYIAHQQGGAGYRSIQAAIADGHFARDDTRSNILNNVSARDLEAVTGHRYAEFSQMSDRDMANTFTQYWDVKFDRVRIPEKGIEPVAQATLPDQATTQPQAIVLQAAHALSVKYDDVRYKMGGKHPERGVVDCSGWGATLQNATMAEINAKAGRDVFGTRDLFSLGYDGAAMIVEKAQARSGTMIEGRDITSAVLREGMIIGEDNGAKSWDRGRYKGIDHITMVVRDPGTGALMISQSRGGEGVELGPLDTYLEHKLARGVQLYATDPLARARPLLQDGPQARRDQDHAPGTGAPAADRVLRHGVHGDDVLGLQRELNRLGLRDAQGRALREDGAFGERTREAVQAYQRAHGLQVDGVAGRETLASLARQRPSGPIPIDASLAGVIHASHPDNPLFQAIRGSLPAHVPDAMAAHATLLAKQNGIDSAGKLHSVTVQGDSAFLLGTTPGFRAKLDLAQPVPAMERIDAQLRATQASPETPSRQPSVPGH